MYTMMPAMRPNTTPSATSLMLPVHATARPTRAPIGSVMAEMPDMRMTKERLCVWRSRWGCRR